ncbi:MAG: MFS transporter [Candidatus Pacebacteria bacterium]|nr:MFS transporter [Candidatus Paceibacterota bacterium]
MKTLLSKYFPSFGVRNIPLYYLLAIFLNGWFILPNWVFYFGQYISKSEIGIVEGVAIFVGILFEVPTGAIADLIGKKKTTLLGSMIIIISCFVITHTTTFLGFLIGNTLSFIGLSFHSGTLEAFAYDSLVEQKKEQHYGVVTARYTTLAIFATIFSTFFGGVLYKINPGFPFYGWAVFLTVSVVIALFSQEPKVDTLTFTLKSYVDHLREGARALFSKNLQNYLVPILAISIFVKLNQGIVRQSMAAYFTFTGETFGYVLAAITIPATFFSFHFDAIRSFIKERALLCMTIGIYCAAFFFAIFLHGPVAGFTIFLAITTLSILSRPLISVIMNKKIGSKHRTTTLSTVALIAQIPYILLVVFVPALTELSNISLLYLGFSAFMGIMLLFSLRFVKAET